MLFRSYVLHRKYEVNYETTFKELVNVLCSAFFMIITLLVLRFTVPQVVLSRLLNILIIAVYTLIGALVYFFITYRIGTVKRIFGEELLDKISKKFKKRKKQ